MKRHLFLTGEKQIGKSTIIRTFLKSVTVPCSGFFTVRVSDIMREAPSVHLLRVRNGTVETPAADNLLFLCRPGEARDSQRFDTLGRTALSVPDDTRLIVMDELGPNEENAVVFQSAVRKTLDGPLPVVGVLQKSGSLFLSGIASRDDVLLIEVNAQNRDHLLSRISDFFIFD